MVCDTPDLGRIKAVLVFMLDDCMSPVYGEATGYIDDCPAAVETSDNVDDGEAFTRRCANGSIKRHLPGEKSLESIEVNVDLHWADAEWLASTGAVTPIMHDGTVIGYGDGTSDKANLLVVVVQEILGGDVCSGDDEGCNNYWRLYPLKGARITEEGDVGAEDSFIRITGETVDTAQLGSGPIPMACDADTGDAEWLSDCLPAGLHRYKFIGGPHPEGCGSIDTEEPETPCTPAS